VLALAALSLIFWLMPGELNPASLFSEHTSDFFGLLATGIYALVVLFLEPFYVAAGFAMYLNRRAQLEAWDIEQELRRAFPE
jgi:hypothetical protein